ncbi:unnamed protein product [Paramecium octaurelia]|uniref:Uncharacterized protein n=1 Tax=Paramecium octaurelia TaxID=43137 RepID=A0A8S1WVJ0_PAROT|nr:unnamed protein product [Paramecium octaurelia]
MTYRDSISNTIFLWLSLIRTKIKWENIRLILCSEKMPYSFLGERA